MSFETNDWTELTGDQAQFFRKHVESAGQIAFSTTAHSAGLVAMNALRYTVQDERALISAPAIMWPDTYEHDTACMVVDGTRPGLSSFLRIQQMPGSLELEGVALDLCHGHGANLYGRQNVPSMRIAEAGIQFLNMAKQGTQAIATTRAKRPLDHTTGLQVTGIDSKVTARLFRSLSTLGANFVVAGAVQEKHSFSGQTYDLAQALFKMVTHGAKQAEGETTLIMRGSLPVGAFFETGEGETVIVQHMTGYPGSIAIATARRPQAGEDTILVEQHTVKARGAKVDTMVLPARLYSPGVIAANLQLIGDNPKGEPVPHCAGVLDELSQGALDQKILRLMTERSRLNAR